MGHTHFWEIDREFTEEEALGVRRDIVDILAVTNVELGGWNGTGAPEIVPLAVSCPASQIGSTNKLVSLNGVGQESCETFTFPGKMGFNFCKTRGRPYDTVVTAILIAAYDRAPEAFGYSSDGGPSDWEAGLRLAEEATGRKLRIDFGH